MKRFKKNRTGTRSLRTYRTVAKRKCEKELKQRQLRLRKILKRRKKIKL